VRVRKLERALEKGRRQAWKDEAPRPVRLDYPRTEILIDGATKRARKRKNATTKEPFTVEWIESLEEGEVLYDIGANIGAYSLIAALRPRGPLRTVAFEPGYATFAVLCTNIVLNGVAEHVIPLPITLGSETALGSFGYADLSAGAALHAGGVDVPVAARYTQPVLVFRLDQLVKQFGLAEPDHLKIDVDGAELAVLQGATGLLGQPSLKTLLIELSERDDEAVEELLFAHGLRRAQTFRRGPEDEERGQFWYALYAR
jgi:FkbM family methyltransferase